MKIDGASLPCFYDDKILILTNNKPLKESTIKNIFDRPTIKTFKDIAGTEKVCPFADATLLHKKRVLHYRTTDRRLFEFNVDIRKNTKIDIEMRVVSIASVDGLDCGVKFVFKSYDDNCTYALNKDDTVTKLNDNKGGNLTTIFPSTSNPKSIKNVVFKNGSVLVKHGKGIDTSKLIKFDANYSVIRVYSDIFLVYNKSIEAWCIIRIVVS